MGVRIAGMLDRIRADMGPFFVARVCLRVRFRIDEDAPDSAEAEQAIIRACLKLGYDYTARRRGRD